MDSQGNHHSSSGDAALESAQPVPHVHRPSPPLESVQVISSLIDSLGKISAATPAREDSREEDNLPERLDRPATPEPLDPDDFDRRQHTPHIPDDPSDDEVAAAPVAGYARRIPLSSKRSSKSKFYSLNMSQPTLAARDSSQSIKSRAESDSVGIPSIERRDRSSVGSALSIVSGFSALRRKPTVESLRDVAAERPAPPRRVSSDRRRKAGSLHSVDPEKDHKWPTRTVSIDGYSPGSSQLDQTLGDSPTVAALRLSRGDLGDHMIPSRRSSLRRSVTSPPNNHQDSSLGMLDEQTPEKAEVDSELMESDNSTVRRIRELQEARERRQKEWRNEARKSERAAKRHTIASPKLHAQRPNAYPSSRLSVTEVVVESEAESPPAVSATVDGSDLAQMPALMPGSTEDEPLTPVIGVTPAISTPASATPSRGNSLYGQPGVHSKKNSVNVPVKQNSGLSELKRITEEVDSFLGASRLTQKIRHPRTGRTIAFSEVGDPQGFVVLCCVGMGLTRYLTAFYDELARTLRLRLITPDRPGVGESSPVSEASRTPLNWVDDVAVICNTLGITRFSLLAHSAGVIYALATALKMPQYVRGRIHLLAPWIPPSQMPKGAAIGPNSQPLANLPLSHKILSVLPAPILKVANSRFLTATSASVDTKPLKTKKNKALDNVELFFEYSFPDPNEENAFGQAVHDLQDERPPAATPGRQRSLSCYDANNEAQGIPATFTTVTATEVPRPTRHSTKAPSISARPVSPRLSPEGRQAFYNQTLTHRMWALATQNANPALDLVVCLERRRPIGFRYSEVTRSVVIHHGAKDTRVPLANVRWLHSVMKRCELRVLKGEGHGLMASATAMASVLGDMAKEWEEWEKIALGKEKRKKDDAASTFSRRRLHHPKSVEAA